MNDERRLDEAIGRLATEIPPTRDLWPAIEGRLAGASAAGVAGRGLRRGGAGFGVAATVLLMAGTAAVTFFLTRDHYGNARAPVADAGSAGQLTPVAASMLPLDYTMARAELMAVLEGSLERLDPASRRVVERNLAEIRSALASIDRALSADPDNASLQQLLVATTQRELGLLRSIQQMAVPTTQEQGT